MNTNEKNYRDLGFFDSCLKDLYKHHNTTNIKKCSSMFLLFKYIIISKGFRAVFFYRIVHQLYNSNIFLIKDIFLFLNLILNNIEISYQAEIGPGLLIPHAQCIVIGSFCIIGNNVTVQQGVTIGANLDKVKNGRKYPIIGDNVLLGAGAKIIGPVIIGENSIVGANSVVVKDIPKNSIAVGIPARVTGTVNESTQIF